MFPSLNRIQLWCWRKQRSIRKATQDGCSFCVNWDISHVVTSSHYPGAVYQFAWMHNRTLEWKWMLKGHSLLSAPVICHHSLLIVLHVNASGCIYYSPLSLRTCLSGSISTLQFHTTSAISAKDIGFKGKHVSSSLFRSTCTTAAESFDVSTTEGAYVSRVRQVRPRNIILLLVGGEKKTFQEND